MKAKVLVVEDEAVSAMALKMCIEAFGYETCTIACSGEEAMAIAEKENPQIVLMDINLPGSLGGVAAAKEIFTRQGVRSIFVSGYPEEDMMDSVRSSACAGYIVKPFELTILEKKLETALKVKA